MMETLQRVMMKRKSEDEQSEHEDEQSHELHEQQVMGESDAGHRF